MAWDQKSKAIPFKGTILALSTDGGSTYKKVAEVTGIGDVGADASEIDVSHTESPDDQMEYIGGMADGSEFTVDGNFVPATIADALYLDHEAVMLLRGTVLDVRITWTDTGGTKWEFPALLKGFRVRGAVGEKVAMSLTFKVSGAMDLSAGA